MQLWAAAIDRYNPLIQVVAAPDADPADGVGIILPLEAYFAPIQRKRSRLSRA
jgi:hypothetical protein